MSNIEYIHRKLTNNEIVYLYEELRDVVVKLVPINDTCVCFAKFKGKKEFSIDKTANTIVDAELGGNIINKEKYIKF